MSCMDFIDLDEQHTNWANEGVLMLHRDDGETGQRRPCPWGNSTLNCPRASLASSKLQNTHTTHQALLFKQQIQKLAIHFSSFDEVQLTAMPLPLQNSI